MRSVETRGVPQLRVTGIEIHVDLTAEAREETLVRQVPADVDEEVGCGSKLQQVVGPAVTADQRGAVHESERRRDSIEVVTLSCASAIELLQQMHVAAEAAEAKQPGKTHPRLTPVPCLVGDRTSNHD